MSDRRPSKLYDPAGALEWWRAEGSKLTLVELYEAVHDPVAAVRRGVESGTIKGEVVEWCDEHGFAITKNAKVCLLSPWGRTHCRQRSERLVIGPVSDGGSET